MKKKNYPKSGHPEEIYILSGFFYPVLDILATLGHFLKTPLVLRFALLRDDFTIFVGEI